MDPVQLIRCFCQVTPIRLHTVYDSFMVNAWVEWLWHGSYYNPLWLKNLLSGPFPKKHKSCWPILSHWGVGMPITSVLVLFNCSVISNPMDCRMSDFPALHNLLEIILMCIESVMSSNHLMLCCPPLLLPSIFPSIRVFSNEWAVCIRYPKYWSFRFSISPPNEYSGLISFVNDWLDFLAVQGTLKSLLQLHSSKASIQCSAFFMVQLSHPHITTGKSIALTIQIFVREVMSLPFNMLSRLVTTLPPRRKHL